jgi:hypothetical protein
MDQLLAYLMYTADAELAPTQRSVSLLERGKRYPASMRTECVAPG